ncbi:MAG TPA: hypothetical protein VEH84_14535 [Alphaproteobacteria bacterium]|nr:hypothetical protein [Alphaproteobacteria bacterium]
MSLGDLFSLSPETLALDFAGLIPGLGQHDNLPGQYGNWCGPGHPISTEGAAPPVDELDRHCQAHDLSTSYGDDPVGARAADRALYEGFLAAAPTDPYAQAYRTAALTYFGARLGEYGPVAAEIASPDFAAGLRDAFF